jgi:hypothetical protein
MILDLQKGNIDGTFVMWIRMKSFHLHVLQMLRISGTVALNIYSAMWLRGVHRENLTSQISGSFGQQYFYNEDLQFLVPLTWDLNNS